MAGLKPRARAAHDDPSTWPTWVLAYQARGTTFGERLAAFYAWRDKRDRWRRKNTSLDSNRFHTLAAREARDRRPAGA